MSAGLRHTPGLKAFGTAGSGPVRGVFYDPGVERLFCVSGGEFYELGEGGAATNGDVATGILPVTWASNGVGGQQIMGVTEPPHVWDRLSTETVKSHAGFLAYVALGARRSRP